MKKIIMVSTIIAVVMSFSIVINCNSQIVESKKIEIKKKSFITLLVANYKYWRYRP